jgi:hypothetical protein
MVSGQNQRRSEPIYAAWPINFYGPHTRDAETHIYKGRRVVYEVKPYSSDNSPPAPPPTAALLRRQIAAIPRTHRRICSRRWLPGAVTQV